jgi:4-hydroxybenzoate polyprenyltransferase
MLRSLKITLEMIKIEHTLFALPFAFLGAVLAAHGLPAPDQIGWIVVAMVGARSAAMAFNRLADRELDAANPRTRTRALPAGLLSARFVALFTLVSAAVFFFAAAMLNRLTLLLAPLALASVLLYSYTKRFTALSHLVLGWCLAIAPTGAWIAVRGAIDSPVPLLLSLAVLLWTAGFDIIYACQDRDFDVRAGLHWLGLLGIFATAALLVYQHRLVRAGDLSRLNVAFFTTNAYVSLILFLTVAADVFFLQ